MEACYKCNENTKKLSKKKINNEIQEFLKAPNKFRVIYNTRTGFYKFERLL